MNDHEVMRYAFRQNYHADKSNAAIHCSEVRFSPLTFRLAECLIPWSEGDAELREVLGHFGQYKEDAGRVAE